MAKLGGDFLSCAPALTTPSQSTLPDLREIKTAVYKKKPAVYK